MLFFENYRGSWWEVVFYIQAGLSCCDLFGTITNRDLFVGVLKVA
jgi:hypothetical protein